MRVCDAKIPYNSYKCKEVGGLSKAALRGSRDVYRVSPPLQKKKERNPTIPAMP